MIDLTPLSHAYVEITRSDDLVDPLAREFLKHKLRKELKQIRKTVKHYENALKELEEQDDGST